MCTAAEAAPLEVATLLRRYGDAYRARYHIDADAVLRSALGSAA